MRPGGAFFVHTDAFVMIRGGHLDLALLGAFEVSGSGDLANWTTGDRRFPPGVGGAMDLAVGAKAVWVLTEHVTKKGELKIVERCRYPLTAPRAVRKVFTDLAEIDVTTDRSEEHTSELQSLMRISYAVFCLKKKR